MKSQRLGFQDSPNPPHREVAQLVVAVRSERTGRVFDSPLLFFNLTISVNPFWRTMNRLDLYLNADGQKTSPSNQNSIRVIFLCAPEDEDLPDLYEDGLELFHAQTERGMNFEFWGPAGVSISESLISEFLESQAL